MSGASPPIELVPGEILDGKYKVERLVGVGGMGAVWIAERLALRDRVAVKSILAAQNTELNRARFLREARAAAAIRHPNVVQVFDFGEPEGRPPYMVMELLEGPTLAETIRRGGPLSLSRALWVFSGVCAAVEAGHRRGVIHRDIKPGNVILARSDDGRETVKVMDFGLARMLDGSDAAPLTNPGSMVGTASYMAPELLESAGAASAASDVYALGVLLYEMTIGKSPFRADSDAGTLVRISRGQYDRPGDVMPALPREVCTGIEAALSRSPTARPRSPEQLAARVGAPLSPSSGDAEISLASLRRRPLEVSAVGVPSELEPSMAAHPGADDDEITASDNGGAGIQFGLDGGERTMAHDEAPSPTTLARTFVGRAAELETLRREYRRALDGRGRIVVVSGDPGVGKSRLCESFATWVHDQGGVPLHGRFYAYEGDHPPPYETFTWMLSSEASSSKSGDLPRGGNRPGGGTPGADKWQAFSSLSRAFVDRGRGRPLVLVLDDLQWATALDLEFLAYLPRAAEHDPVLVVGTARTGGPEPDEGELDRWLTRLGSQRALATVRLRGFGTGEVRAWFQACFPGIRMRPREVRRLQTATGGNPYYMVEVVSQLVEERTIRRDAGAWACAPLDDIELPDTVHAVVKARLDALQLELRETLETACVLGEEFRFETLQRATGIDEAELERRLEQAVHRGLLSEDALAPGSDYRFESSTLRGVLYGELSKRRRQRLHRAVVQAMGDLYGPRDADRIAKVLCYHHDAVGDHPATLEWGLRAAAETLRRHDNDHAEVSLARARRAAEALQRDGIDTDRETSVELDLWSGVLHVRIGRLDEAHEELQRALAATEGDAALASVRLDVLLALVECGLARGELDPAIADGERAIAAARALGDDAREQEARLQTAKCAAPHGLLDRAAALLQPIVDDRSPAHASRRALALAELAWVHAKRGDFDRAMALTHEAKHLARQCGDLLAEYRAVSVQGLTQLEGGDQAAAIPRLEQALELARGLSLRRREGVELHNLGECFYFLGRLDEALAKSRQALAIFLEIHDRGTEGDCRVNLGRTLMAQGHATEALDELTRGQALAARAGRSEYEGLALLELSLSDLEAGRLDDADEKMGRARDLFRAMGSLYLWRAELGSAKIARARGDVSLARERAHAAADLVEAQRARLGGTLDAESFARSVAEVRAWLDELG